MKLHDLRPAEGSRQARTRVGRGIAAGKGKTAGRGTKGQMSRTGHGAMPSWFEGGQTPIHVRLPKLRGFKNPFRVEYEIVNVGLLSALAETGVLDIDEAIKDGTVKPSKSGKPIPVTITPDILAAAGLVRTLNKPLKILGHGDVSRAMFVVADAFTKSAIAKIEAAGGTAHVLEFPTAGEDDELDLMPASLPPTSAAESSADDVSATEASDSDPVKGA
jgi:large subunit ribosomal protein L15